MVTDICQQERSLIVFVWQEIVRVTAGDGLDDWLWDQAQLYATFMMGVWANIYLLCK
jgi:hypothetical protein